RRGRGRRSSGSRRSGHGGSRPFAGGGSRLLAVVSVGRGGRALLLSLPLFLSGAGQVDRIQGSAVGGVGGDRLRSSVRQLAVGFGEERLELGGLAVDLGLDCRHLLFLGGELPLELFQLVTFDG